MDIYSDTKNWTTSIRTQLRQIGKPLIPNPHLNILQVRDAIDIFLKKNLATNRSFPSVEVRTYSQIKNDSASFFLMLLNFPPFETLGNELFPFFEKKAFRIRKIYRLISLSKTICMQVIRVYIQRYIKTNSIGYVMIMEKFY